MIRHGDPPEAVAWAIAAVDVETIDRINIRRASLLAMRMAVEQLAVAPDCLLPDYLLIDGCDTIDWPCPQQAVVQGRRTERFNCGGERAGEGASRPVAGGAGCSVSRVWAGAAQGLLLGRTHGGTGAAGTDTTASQELSTGSAEDAGV